MEVKVVNNHVHVVLSGSIAEEDAIALQENLISHINAERSRFIIDFSDVDFICGDGIGILFSIRQRVYKKGGSVAITGLMGNLRTRFELNRMDRFFEIN